MCIADASDFHVRIGMFRRTGFSDMAGYVTKSRRDEFAHHGTDFS